jgi:Rrf2 family protein
MSTRKQGELVARSEVAQAMEIPSQFLAKIAQQLSRAGFIEIVQGARGGYRLLVSPEDITLLDVVESISGEILLNDCLMRPGTCSRDATCPVHRVWHKARTQLRQTLSQATFQQLSRDIASSSGSSCGLDLTDRAGVNHGPLGAKTED